MSRMQDLARTLEALRNYDTYHDGLNRKVGKALTRPGTAAKEIDGLFSSLEQKGRDVGHAFGMDTAPRNDVGVCEDVVRPSIWLRKVVSDWEATTN